MLFRDNLELFHSFSPFYVLCNKLYNLLVSGFCSKSADYNVLRLTKCTADVLSKLINLAACRTLYFPCHAINLHVWRTHTIRSTCCKKFNIMTKFCKYVCNDNVRLSWLSTNLHSYLPGTSAFIHPFVIIALALFPKTMHAIRRKSSGSCCDSV